MDEKWERVGKALQDDAQYVVDDHLPERWIELIKRLNCSIPQSSYWSRALTARSFLANAPLKSAFRANCQEHGRVRDVVNERDRNDTKPTSEAYTSANFRIHQTAALCFDPRLSR